MNIYEAMNMIRNAWANVSTSTISNCWIKSGIAGYWNIIKIAPQNQLIKFQEKQAIDYATSEFSDLDVQNMFLSYEEASSFEEETLRKELEGKRLALK